MGAHQVEKDAHNAILAWEEEANRLNDDDARLALMTKRSNAFVKEAVANWWTFAFNMFAKFGRFAITYNESTKGQVGTRYPEWWLRSPEVGFTSWKEEGPYHGVLLDENFSTLSTSFLLGNIRNFDGTVVGGWGLVAAFSCGVMLTMIAGFVIFKAFVPSADSKNVES